MPECFVCFYQFEQDKRMNCQCQICPNCYFQYLQTSIDSLSFNFKTKIKCPNLDCLSSYSINEYLEIFGNEALDNKLLLKYLQSDLNIRNCPKKGCVFYGYLPEKYCSGNFICDICSYEWKDNTNVIWSEKIFQFIKSISTVKSDIFTYIYEYIMTKECPNCGIPITKNGGCMHMNCKKCSYDFCWICKQNFVSHNRVQCMAYFNTKYGILISTLSNFIVQLEYHLIIMNCISYCLLVIGYSLLYNILLLLMLLFFYFLGDSIKYHNVLQNNGYNQSDIQKRKISIVLSIALLTLCFSYISIIYYFQETFYQAIQFIFVEGIIVCVTYCLLKFLEFLWQTWMMFVR